MPQESSSLSDRWKVRAGSPTPGRDYTVRLGDTLWGISKAAYRSGRWWTAIAVASGIPLTVRGKMPGLGQRLARGLQRVMFGEIVVDVDPALLLTVGQVLKIPRIDQLPPIPPHTIVPKDKIT